MIGNAKLEDGTAIQFNTSRNELRAWLQSEEGQAAPLPVRIAVDDEINEFGIIIMDCRVSTSEGYRIKASIAAEIEADIARLNSRIAA